jgi:hypothetical protein
VQILLDHSTPAPLRYWLLGHKVDTAYERRWSEVSNGKLLRLAEDHGFDLMITGDKSIRYQQNMAGRRIAIIVLSTNDWTQIRNWRSTVMAAISRVEPGSFIEIEIPPR